MKKIKININNFNRYFSTKFKKTLFFVIRLEFMESKKVSISVFNRYLILFFLVLFSYLFYLSVPTIYNYGVLQKDLNNKLLKDFNLNTSLSANITYKILPSPNFEITNVLLNTNSENELKEYAQIKKMKIYISSKNLFDQKKLEIKRIAISEANIHLDKDSYNYFNSFLSKKFSNKKINIKKSKIFFEQKKDKKNVIALSTINKIDLFYEDKENNNLINIEGSIFNTTYRLTLLRNILKKNTTHIKIKLNRLNSEITNEFNTYSGQTYDHDGKASLNFLGSELNIDYKITDKLIKFNSLKSRINNEDILFNGDIDISPFNYQLKLKLKSLNIKKLQKYLPRIKNLLDEKILLNKNINGKILINADTLKGIKFFNSANINLSILNKKIVLNNSVFISDKIGNMILKDCVLEIVDGEKIIKLVGLLKVLNEKKFYQKIQIPKSNRIKIKNIYFEMEKNLDKNELNIKKFIINKKDPSFSAIKEFDLTEQIDLDHLNNIQNWIEFKKYSAELFLETKNLN